MVPHAKIMFDFSNFSWELHYKKCLKLLETHYHNILQVEQNKEKDKSEIKHCNKTKCVLQNDQIFLGEIHVKFCAEFPFLG